MNLRVLGGYGFLPGTIFELHESEPNWNGKDVATGTNSVHPPVYLPVLVGTEIHDHHAPEMLGKVSFPISCAPAVEEQFNRGVALLHSFAYTASQNAFQRVAELDPRCAMAHWGIAMGYFHQLCSR